MTKSYRDKLSEIRDKLSAIQDQNNVKADQERNANNPDREDQLLGDIELVNDANDLPSEVRKNLASDLLIVDTELEIIAKGLNKKDEPEDEEPENSSTFRP